MEISGQCAVVTGGGSGIGRGLALALFEAGASVMVADIDEAAARAVADEIAERGGRSISTIWDVRDPAAMARLR